MIAIGLMSGTSLDGVDAALVEIKDDKFELLKFITHVYDNSFKTKLMRNLHDSSAKLSEICSLNFELGYKFLDAINKLLENTKYSYDDICFVASHGQTIFHNPNQIGSNIPSTLQIGESSVITYHTNIQVISDFRVMDIVAGGQGAPLVPMSEYMIYKDEAKNVVLQNIGGIGNLTYLPKGGDIDDVKAFDTGPGNAMIDYFVNRYFGLPFDDGGKIALNGRVIPNLFEYLKQDSFIQSSPPKSTGRELYTKEFMEGLVKRFALDDEKKEDVVTTITEFTAYSICLNYQKFLGPIDLVIVNGGGSHNKYIIKRLKEILNVKVITGDEYGIPSDAKEAIAFVVLGYLTLTNRAGNVKSATGAKKSVVLGKITPKGNINNES
ncbi:MAG: anhydro-N-acetylmuramic acid kinase AnmK [Bacilli bacterium]|nr:anhydro-N-acetylmuramic acid kinase AnmK [Bacilli bacterium]